MSLKVISVLCQEASGLCMFGKTQMYKCAGWVWPLRFGVCLAGLMWADSHPHGFHPALLLPPPRPLACTAQLCVSPRRGTPLFVLGSPGFCLLPPGGLSSTSPVLTDPITVRYYGLIVSIFLCFLSSLPMCRGFQACFISSLMKSATF